jgi:predicted nucleic acid-binding protein
MGVILDSSVLIAAERGGQSVRDILKRVQAKQGETESALSAVTIVELTHGIYRAETIPIASADEHLPTNCYAT